MKAPVGGQYDSPKDVGADGNGKGERPIRTLPLGHRGGGRRSVGLVAQPVELLQELGLGDVRGLGLGHLLHLGLLHLAGPELLGLLPGRGRRGEKPHLLLQGVELGVHASIAGPGLQAEELGLQRVAGQVLNSRGSLNGQLHRPFKDPRNLACDGRRRLDGRRVSPLQGFTMRP